MTNSQVREIFVRLKGLFNQDRFSEVKKLLSKLTIPDLLTLFSMLDIEDSIIAFRLLHKNSASVLFSRLNIHQKRKFVLDVNQNLPLKILDALSAENTDNLLEEMPVNFTKFVLTVSPVENRQLINNYLNFPLDSAGSIMTANYIELFNHMTVKEAKKAIKDSNINEDFANIGFVLDTKRHIIGVIPTHKLSSLPDNQDICSIIKETQYVSVREDQEDIADVFKKFDLISIPVVDQSECIVGVIHITDILDVIEEENTEDFEKMAGMVPSDEVYLKASVFQLARKRIVWLIILMFTATITGGIITHYEKLLSSAVVLTAFIPMLMNSGGNAGSQSSTLIIRGMALDEIRLTDWLSVLWKEFRVGLLAGSILSVINFFRMFLFGSSDISIISTVSLTLLLTIVSAKMVGGILPIVSKALHLDPAIMAGPFITTIVDTFSLVFFFSIASILI